jgi:hypothetical protein
LFHTVLISGLLAGGLYFDRGQWPVPEFVQETFMNTDNPGKAEHGAPSEVTWKGGKGRQPYANQGPEEATPAGGGAFEQGDRGDLSGRHVEQVEQAAKKP